MRLGVGVKATWERLSTQIFPYLTIKSHKDFYKVLSAPNESHEFESCEHLRRVVCLVSAFVFGGRRLNCTRPPFPKEGASSSRWALLKTLLSYNFIIIVAFFLWFLLGIGAFPRCITVYPHYSVNMSLLPFFLLRQASRIKP